MGQAIDLTGQVFGRLTVLERDGYYVSPRGARHINWLVRCSCADVITHATTSQLRRKGNPVQSCGCLRRETNRERLLIDLTGARFGKLTVVRRLGTKTFPGGATQPLWQAQCEYRASGHCRRGSSPHWAHDLMWEALPVHRGPDLLGGAQPHQTSARQGQRPHVRSLQHGGGE